MTSWLLFAWLCVNIVFLIVNVKTYGAIQRAYTRAFEHERNAKEQCERLAILQVEATEALLTTRKLHARHVQVVKYGLTANRLN